MAPAKHSENWGDGPRRNDERPGYDAWRRYRWLTAPSRDRRDNYSSDESNNGKERRRAHTHTHSHKRTGTGELFVMDVTTRSTPALDWKTLGTHDNDDTTPVPEKKNYLIYPLSRSLSRKGFKGDGASRGSPAFERRAFDADGPSLPAARHFAGRSSALFPNAARSRPQSKPKDKCGSGRRRALPCGRRDRHTRCNQPREGCQKSGRIDMALSRLTSLFPSLFEVRTGDAS